MRGGGQPEKKGAVRRPGLPGRGVGEGDTRVASRTPGRRGAAPRGLSAKWPRGEEIWTGLVVLDLGERVKGDSRQPEGQRREERASSWI